MGWSVGHDQNWDRDIGYDVPAICDHPGCGKEIHRGLDYVCGGQPYGGDRGCGLFFCYEHGGGHVCERCAENKEPFDAKPDVKEWVQHKLTHASWARWRAENPREVEKMKAKP